jgi:glucan biosynthesis protein C
MNPASPRRLELDWIRILVTLAVLVFHCARAFDHEGWHVKNPEQSVAMDLVVGLLVLWIMPAFFVLSGFGARYSLAGRSAGSYCLARVRRLLIPFAFGTLVLIPPQVYIERVSHGQFAGSFFEFFPHYFDGWYAFGGNFAWMGLHLWYLEALFLFSLLTLPLFAWLGRRPVDEGAPTFFQRPGALLLWCLPLAVVQLLVNLQPEGVGRRDFGGWSLLVYLVFFGLGFFLARDGRIRAGLLRTRWIALATGLSVTALLLSARFIPAFGALFGETAGYWLGSTLRPLAAWCWVLGLLGFGARHLDREHRVRRYANEAVLPFYMLHQTVIVVLAFWMLGWSAGVGVKYGVLLLASFAAIMILYEGLVRRLRPLRALFGMGREQGA